MCLAIRACDYMYKCGDYVRLKNNGDVVMIVSTTQHTNTMLVVKDNNKFKVHKNEVSNEFDYLYDKFMCIMTMKAVDNIA